MSSLTTKFAEILATAQQPGRFFSAGATEFYAPQLEVGSIGPIALPLLPVQAEQLVAIAEQAPYGRGEETVLDTSVRRTWQISAEHVKISGRNWPHTLDMIIQHCAKGLGVSAPVSAELYKLLIYDEGSFFIRHRDTEKAPGMFATLIIVLPSLHQGGELLIRHRDQQVRLDMGDAEPSEITFAAFYADCIHEVLPVTSGYRLALVYNLTRPNKTDPQQVPDYEAEQTQLAALLKHWRAALQRDQYQEPEKLVYPLEHAYTPAELSFAALKGSDDARAMVLSQTAAQTDCELHLALLTIEESGGAEFTGYYSRRGRWYESDDEDFEAVEVFDRSQSLSHWCRPDGSSSDWGEIPFHDEELCPPHSTENLEPDEQYFHEATGNEGASFERTYRRAALVVWPRARRLVVLNQAGLAVTLPYLSELAQQWAEQGSKADSSLWQQAHELVDHMLRTWPVRNDYSYRAHAGQNGQMLNSLVQLQNTAAIQAFLNQISAHGDYGKEDNQAIIAALDLLPLAQAVALSRKIIAANAFSNLSGCAEFLALCTTASPFNKQPAKLKNAAKVLLDSLPGDPQRSSDIDPWRRAKADADSVINLLSALERIDTSLAEQAADYMLQWPEAYNPDKILIPAVLSLLAESPITSAVQQLRAACLSHLRTRIAEPLAPPSDWTRPHKLSCNCTDCKQLSQFLAAAEQSSWIFQAAEKRRSHVASTIRNNHCDVDTKTQKQGRPYRLICTKNQASYERRARQRRQDLDHLARLE